jgi:hypothetical protein
MAIIATLLIKANDPINSIFLRPVDPHKKAYGHLIVNITSPSTSSSSSCLASDTSMPRFLANELLGFGGSQWSTPAYSKGSAMYGGCTVQVECLDCSIGLDNELAFSIPMAKQYMVVSVTTIVPTAANLPGSGTRAEHVWLARPSSNTSLLAGTIVHTSSVSEAFHQDMLLAEGALGSATNPTSWLTTSFGGEVDRKSEVAANSTVAVKRDSSGSSGSSSNSSRETGSWKLLLRFKRLENAEWITYASPLSASQLILSAMPALGAVLSVIRIFFSLCIEPLMQLLASRCCKRQLQGLQHHARRDNDVQAVDDNLGDVELFEITHGAGPLPPPPPPPAVPPPPVEQTSLCVEEEIVMLRAEMKQLKAIVHALKNNQL